MGRVRERGRRRRLRRDVARAERASRDADAPVTLPSQRRGRKLDARETVGARRLGVGAASDYAAPQQKGFRTA